MLQNTYARKHKEELMIANAFSFFFLIVSLFSYSKKNAPDMASFLNLGRRGGLFCSYRSIYRIPNENQKNKNKDRPF